MRLCRRLMGSEPGPDARPPESGWRRADDDLGIDVEIGPELAGLLIAVTDLSRRIAEKEELVPITILTHSSADE